MNFRFLNSLRKNILYPDVYHLNPKKSDTEFFRNVTKHLPTSISWYGAYLFKVSDCLRISVSLFYLYACQVINK